ncbi:hypothetical protein QOT17_013747 [Balamuthia mandrillaris]
MRQRRGSLFFKNYFVAREQPARGWRKQLWLQHDNFHHTSRSSSQCLLASSLACPSPPASSCSASASKNSCLQTSHLLCNFSSLSFTSSGNTPSAPSYTPFCCFAFLFCSLLVCGPLCLQRRRKPSEGRVWNRAQQAWWQKVVPQHRLSAQVPQTFHLLSVERAEGRTSARTEEAKLLSKAVLPRGYHSQGGQLVALEVNELSSLPREFGQLTALTLSPAATSATTS